MAAAIWVVRCCYVAIEAAVWFMWLVETHGRCGVIGGRGCRTAVRLVVVRGDASAIELYWLRMRAVVHESGVVAGTGRLGGGEAEWCPTAIEVGFLVDL
ncbi:hypothetical protein RYX36_016099 [Vicia faba]